MAFGDFVKSQFIDVIEHVDESSKLLVYKYERYKDEIKQGARLIVREGQAAVFVNKGVIADVLLPGSYRLDSGNLPVLSSLGALPSLFNSPIKSDLYFINTTQFIGNRFGTKNPVILKDAELGPIRMTAFGTYSFRICAPLFFIREVFGARKLNMTYDIIQYLNSFVLEAFTKAIADAKIPVLELAASYREISDATLERANEDAKPLGIKIETLKIENISLPENVEKLVDEQAGIAFASKNMEAYTQYHTIRALRDAAQQDGGLAGLGAGIAFANKIGSVANEGTENSKDSVEKLREYKSLLDEGIITQEEFESIKKQILKI